MRRPSSSGDFRRRALLLGLLSLLVAGATGAAVWMLASDFQSSVVGLVGEPGMPLVVGAKRRLPPGTVITPRDLELIAGSPSAEGVFRSFGDVVGKTVADEIFPAEPVRAARLTSGAAGLSLEALVTAGRRAVTVLVSRSGAVGGRVRPGSHVDVVLTIRPERGAVAKEWVADTILQNVRVIGVGDRIGAVTSVDPDEMGAAEGREIYVTLDLLPEEGERLALAAARGQLLLALRSPNDEGTEPYGTPVVTNSLLGLSDPVIASIPVPERQRTQIIMGSEVRKVETFDGDGHHISTTRPAGSRR